MKSMRVLGVAVCAVALFSLAGCGVSKDTYEAALNDKIMLEEKARVYEKAKDALKAEYDNLLKEKMDIAMKLATLTNEKEAMRGEYDKILDEKITLRAEYDKLLAETRATTKAKTAKP